MRAPRDQAERPHMRSFLQLTSAFALGVSALTPVAAHSLAELQAMLVRQERYFQPVDKAAPQFKLRDAHNRVVDLTDFRGKVIVLHFIRTSSEDEGSARHAQRIAELQSMINLSPMKARVEFISITTDPNKDTPDVLRAYGRLHGLDHTNWVFLTTMAEQSEATTRKLAEQFEHKVASQDEAYQAQGFAMHVIDKDGRWRGNFLGLKFEPTNLVVFVNALVNDIAKPHAH